VDQGAGIVTKSSFGQGYAVCLRQFLWHEPRLREDVDLYADMEKRHPGMFGEKHAVEIWASGAVDHLFDLRRPRRWVTNAEWIEAKRLRDTMIGAKWGPGFRYMDGPLARAYSEAEIRALLQLADSLLDSYAKRGERRKPETFRSAWNLDIAAGLRPQKGYEATCMQPIPTRQSRPSSKKATP
jgi:hypothetical protein